MNSPKTITISSRDLPSDSLSISLITDALAAGGHGTSWNSTDNSVTVVETGDPEFTGDLETIVHNVLEDMRIIQEMVEVIPPENPFYPSSKFPNTPLFCNPNNKRS
jgi:hypothetical protein